VTAADHSEARRAWDDLMEERRRFPDQVPAPLERLVEAARSSGAFPICCLALRALADCDERRRLRELAERLAVAAPGGATLLAVAEARLECAELDGAALLGEVDVHRCAPLRPEIARTWQRWLAAEFLWWESGRAPTAELPAELLAAPEPQDDPYSVDEWQRLRRRIAALAFRSALARGHVDEARSWLGAAAAGSESWELWEPAYLNGLLAWSQGRHRSARAQLGQSLAANPLQSRVRFELSLLSGVQEGGDAPLPETPPIHDALALSAWALLHAGRTAEAAEQLDRMAEEETPYSLRLIWPQARSWRLARAAELRAHLAEGRQDWPEALRLWDAARQGSRSLVHRSHRLYLLGRLLATSHEEAPREKAHFEQELGKLAIRPLTGEAMFYRALAAAATMPDRARADWQALVRQRRWRQQAGRRRLLVLGDRLWRAGELAEAHQVYRDAGESEQLFLSRLAVEASSASPEAALAFLDRVRQLAVPERRQRQWELLARLARSPAAACEPDPEALADLDVAAPWQWQVFRCAKEALELACDQDFDAAERACARAFAALERKDENDDL